MNVGDPGGREIASQGPRAATLAVPSRVAKPLHLLATYVAPPQRRTSTVGRLAIARLRIDAAVVPVGWDADTMAVPNDPSTLGWFEPSARLDDLAGTSLIAGHVSDASERPGALASLEKVRAGDVVEWRPRGGGVLRFRVVAIERFPRTDGLPTSLFRVDGPHMLRLVTCTKRVEGPGSAHYADNLVVSAVRV